ncbi:MAG: hypothetical protein LC677_15625 [Halomonas sp.]|nr:hypothetical protein [Halomonas sp.]
MTDNKRRILEALSLTNDHANLEWGTPPRNAATVASILSLDVSNVARTLRNMEHQGLVQAEDRMIDVWCEVPKPGHYPRLMRCYWCIETMEQDKAAADAWQAGSKERSRKAEEKMMAMMGQK